MSTVTENDLKRLEDLIIASREENRQKFTSLEAGQGDLKERLTVIETRLSSLEGGQSDLKERLSVIEARFDEWRPSISKIPDLAVQSGLGGFPKEELHQEAEKVGELKNWKQVGLVFVTAVVSSIFSGTIGGVIGWLIRGPRA